MSKTIKEQYKLNGKIYELLTIPSAAQTVSLNVNKFNYYIKRHKKDKTFDYYIRPPSNKYIEKMYIVMTEKTKKLLTQLKDEYESAKLKKKQTIKSKKTNNQISKKKIKEGIIYEYNEDDKNWFPSRQWFLDYNSAE